MSHYTGTALWLLVTMTTAIGSYTVNLKVAGARSEVATLREQLVRDARAIRTLQAELRTRARLPEMQRWNDSTLKMSAPAAGQYLASPAILAGFVPQPHMPDAGVPGPRYAVTGPTPRPVPMPAPIRVTYAAQAAAGIAKPGMMAVGYHPSNAVEAKSLRRPGAEPLDPLLLARTFSKDGTNPMNGCRGHPCPPEALKVVDRSSIAGFRTSRTLAIAAPIDLLPAGAR